MGVKDLFKRLTTSQADHDHGRLRAFLADKATTTSIGDLVAREEATVAGEIRSLRIVPTRDGSPWLEATISDGTGVLVVLWTGRRRIAGVRPGAKIMATGRPTPAGRTGRPTIYNPLYELL